MSVSRLTALYPFLERMLKLVAVAGYICSLHRCRVSIVFGASIVPPSSHLSILVKYRGDLLEGLDLLLIDSFCEQQARIPGWADAIPLQM